jgi:hypothetical protein
MVTPFLTPRVTPIGDFTQEMVGHTGAMVNRRTGTKCHTQPGSPAKPGLNRRRSRVGQGRLTAYSDRALGWTEIFSAATSNIPDALLERLLTTHSSPSRCSARASRNRVSLFSPGQSPDKVISAEQPHRILGPTRCASGKIPMLQPGNLLILRPMNNKATLEVSND